MTLEGRPRLPDYLAVALAAGVGLCYELLLLRVFSFSQWHHFASLAVSMALLGFGAAGTLLSVLGQRAVRWGDRLFLTGLLMGGFGIIASFLVTRQVAVRPLFAIWDTRELGKLLLLDLVAFIPFFGLALSIGQVFVRWPKSTARLYGANLLGAGFGSLLAAVLLSQLFLETALLCLAATTLAAGGLYAALHCRAFRIGGLGLAGAAGAALWIVLGLPSLPVSDFKALSYLRDLPDVQVLEERPGLRAGVTVLRSDSIRKASGLSLNWQNSVRPQDALVLDADRALSLPRSLDEAPDFFRATSAHIPFVLRPEGPAAVLGSGPRLGMVRATGRPSVWIESNPKIIDVFTKRGLPHPPRILNGDPRQFMRNTSTSYDLIFLDGDTGGGDAANETYLLTVESLTELLDRLSPEGILAIPLALNYPPRYAPKLLNTAAAALQAAGRDAPGDHCAMLRSMREGLLMIFAEPMSLTDREKIRSFVSTWNFDLCALPGLQPEEANRFHQLDTPVFYQTARAVLLGEGEIPPEADWYRSEPATDTRPYFHHSMKWDNLPELWNSFGRRGLVWLDWAIIILTIKSIAIALLALLLILLPLGRLPRARPPVSRLSVCAYFTALGLGFLLLEMAVFQRSVFFLAHPVSAAALVFAVFLAGSGWGSFGAPDDHGKGMAHRIFLPIVCCGCFLFVALWLGGRWIGHAAVWSRYVLLAALILPLAWSLGRAMPWGLRRLDASRALIPWAWGINGFASVLAAPLAALISIQAGQWTTWIIAGLCYIAAWRIGKTWTAAENESG